MCMWCKLQLWMQPILRGCPQLFAIWGSSARWGALLHPGAQLEPPAAQRSCSCSRPCGLGPPAGCVTEPPQRPKNFTYQRLLPPLRSRALLDVHDRTPTASRKAYIPKNACKVVPCSACCRSGRRKGLHVMRCMHAGLCHAESAPCGACMHVAVAAGEPAAQHAL